MDSFLDHGGNVYRAARETSREVGELCDFSASINPLGIPLSVRRAVKAALPRIAHYPDLQGVQLRQALSNFHKIDSQNILLGNGSTELIYALSQAFGVKHGLVIGPTFTEYERALNLAGARCANVLAQSTNNYAPPLDEACHILHQNPKVFGRTSGFIQGRKSPVGMVFLCNPNSPTGQGVSRAAVLRLLAKVRESGSLLVVDETFVDFCERDSVLREAARDESLLILRSFTKFYAMPGLRIGYMVASSINVVRVQALLPPWSVNTLAQEAALAALGDHVYRKASLAFMEKERQRFLMLLQDIPHLRVYPSRANFILVELPVHLTSDVVTDALRRKGLLVRNCAGFPGMNERTLRLAVRKSRDNNRLVRMLKKVMREIE